MTAALDYGECEVCEAPYSNYGTVLHCPWCGFVYVEIQSVTLIDSSGRTVTAYPGSEDGGGGFHVQQGIQPVDGQRRHLVRMHLRCEDGHDWTLDLRQEKGMTVLAAVPVAVAAELPTSPTGGTAA